MFFESGSGEYESQENQVPLGATYADCQEPVEMGLEDENLILKYAKNLKPNETNRKFWKEVAKLAGKPEEKLFPNAVKQVANSKKHSSASILEQCIACKVNHNDYTNYKMEESDYYFQSDKRKWFGLKCRGTECGKTIGVLKGNFRPTSSTPVYVCREFALDKTDCRQMVCSKCYLVQESGSPGGRSRRARKGTTTN